MMYKIRTAREQKWHEAWHKYAEFLRENGRRADHVNHNERGLDAWYTLNLIEYQYGRLDNEQRRSFVKLTDDGDTYKFYVADRRRNILRLTSSATGGNANGKTGNYDKDNFDRTCKMYAEFCSRMERHPMIEIREEAELAKWYVNAEDDFFSNRLDDHENKLFERLLKKISGYRNYNVTRLIPKPADSNDEEEKDPDKKRNAVKQDALWNEKWQAYMDFMAVNKRRPSRYKDEDLVLFDWYKHSKKLLNQGKMRADRIEKFNQLIDYAKGMRQIARHKEDKATPPTTEIHLYDYQQDMKDRIENAYRSYKSVMVQMPTGTGKTHVVAAVVRDFIHNRKNSLVWVVAHRRELVKQMKRTLAVYLSKDEQKQVLATSIQWLSLHYNDMTEKPSLIVIDEAHHVVAKTYAAVMNAYPKAWKLGVTATPYRLSGEGFSDLFDVLLTSSDIRTFIARKRLCPFDYYVVGNNSEEVTKLIDLKKRGKDGDYQTKELDRRFNDTGSIRRLYDSYMKYAAGRKGFVYAISIHHAENIAEYYQNQGINAMAISSKTPEKERDRLISDFREGKITLLVSCDMISEGFDYPDAEVIQIARPTLSLAKYLQMVGRGLRTAKGKEYCIIIDNVGLAGRFGLPDRERDWYRYFKGTDKDYQTLADLNLMGIGNHAGKDSGSGNEIYLAMSHIRQEEELRKAEQVHVFEDGKGRKGLKDSNGNIIFECVHREIEISSYGIVTAVNMQRSRQWYDLYNGILYHEKPVFDYMGDLPVAIVAGYIFPRIKSKWITQNTRISANNIRNLFDSGLEWTVISRGDEIRRTSYYIPWTGKLKVYRIVQSLAYGARLMEDENGNEYAQQNPDTGLTAITGGAGEMKTLFATWKEEYDDFVSRARKYPVTYIKVSSLPSCGYKLEKEGGGIIEATSPEGNTFWVDTLTRRKFDSKPRAGRKGGAKILFVDDYVFVRDNEFEQPVQYWQVEADTDGYFRVSSDTHVSSLKDYHVRKMDWWWKSK